MLLRAFAAEAFTSSAVSSERRGRVPVDDLLTKCGYLLMLAPPMVGGVDKELSVQGWIGQRRSARTIVPDSPGPDPPETVV